jgi:Zn-dependent M28 family amino/carboxypeptidase
MRIRVKHIIPLSIITVVAFATYILFKNFPEEPKRPYPSLDKQRAAIFNKPFINPVRILDSVSIVNDLKYLASDICEGRKPGSAGHEKAVERIIARMRETGLDSFNNSLVQEFTKGGKNTKARTGKNIIGWIKGTHSPEKYIIITAHYDHLGKIGDSVYYGASDNASGTACILAMSEYFKHNPMPCSLIFAAFDMEESGLEGATYFVNNPPIRLSEIKLNINIDMIVRNDANEVFICGIYHYPKLINAVNEMQNETNSKILLGHDTGSRHDDWTNQSDHYAFHQKKVPFLYIGVEDHIDYHRPTDTYDKIDLASFIENCNLIAMLTQKF